MADYWPRFQKQLVDGVPTKGDDCVVRTASMGIDYQTRGARIPTVKQFRTRAGKLTEGLNTLHLQAGVQSYDTPTETNGYTDLVCWRRSEGEWSSVVDALANERWVACWINYGWLNDNYPELSGDKAFRKTHCIGALRLRRSDGVWEVRAYDPLYDGRRANIPSGPQWWPLNVLRRACAEATGVTEFRGGIMPAAVKLGAG